MQNAAAMVAIVTGILACGVYGWYLWRFCGLKEIVLSWWVKRQEAIDDLARIRRMWEIS